MPESHDAFRAALVAAFGGRMHMAVAASLALSPSTVSGWVEGRRFPARVSVEDVATACGLRAQQRRELLGLYDQAARERAEARKP